MSSPRRIRKPYVKFNIEDLPKLTFQQVKRRIMDLMAKRDHSAKEIRDKLKKRVEPETMQQALDWAKEQNWLPSDEKIQDQVVRALRNRKKGQNAINFKLKKMGLPAVKLDPEDEFKNAVRALESKFKSDILKSLDFKEFQKVKAKVMRFLIGKGFNSTVIQKAVKQYFEK